MRKLYKALLNIAKENINGLTYEEALYYIDNDAIPSDGNVSGLIYCSETEELAKKFHDEIVNLMEELEVDRPLKLNDMAWFAWEALIFGNGERVLKDLGWSKEEEIQSLLKGSI